MNQFEANLAGYFFLNKYLIVVVWLKLITTQSNLTVCFYKANQCYAFLQKKRDSYGIT